MTDVLLNIGFIALYGVGFGYTTRRYMNACYRYHQREYSWKFENNVAEYVAFSLVGALFWPLTLPYRMLADRLAGGNSITRWLVPDYAAEERRKEQAKEYREKAEQARRDASTLRENGMDPEALLGIAEDYGRMANEMTR